MTFFDTGFSEVQEVTAKAIEGKGVPDDDPQLLSTTVADNELVYDVIMFSSEAEERFPAEPHEAVYGRDLRHHPFRSSVRRRFPGRCGQARSRTPQDDVLGSSADLDTLPN